MDAAQPHSGAIVPDAVVTPALVQQAAAPSSLAERHAGILDGERRGGSDDADTWLLTVAICIPVSASVGVVVAYSIAHDPFRAFAVGGIVGAVALGLLLALYRIGRFNRAQHASVDMYNELCRRMDHALRAVPTPDPDDAVRRAQDRAFHSVAASGEAFQLAREKRGMHWVLGRGYVDLQSIVHRAEENLILYEPLEGLLNDALLDQARLTGSQIPSRDDLLNRLRRALTVLDPASVQYLPSPPCPSAPSAPSDAQPGTQQMNPRMTARVMLQDVRYQVNTFREDRRHRLIQARDNLVSTLFLTGLVTILLVALLVIGRPTQATLLGGAILYAVGMLVGLFVHLSAALDAGKRQEDYGLATVALFQITALSGIAAVLGAYVGVTFPAVMDVNKVNAQSLAAIPGPAQVYDLAHYSVAIIFGLIFAMAPRLLLQRLAAGITQTQNELKTSSAGN
jgi:hypothetical protein